MEKTVKNDEKIAGTQTRKHDETQKKIKYDQKNETMKNDEKGRKTTKNYEKDKKQ